MSEQARFGWGSGFPEFREASPRKIRETLRAFVRDASDEQLRAWDESIPPLQVEIGEVLTRDELAAKYSAILEYELPMDSRRPDVILLVGASVIVVELKGKTSPSQADLDQVAGYARDLMAYHRECQGRPVIPVLVPTRARGYQQELDGVHVAGPDALDALVSRLDASTGGNVITRDAFLAHEAYRPLPTIVEAARELLNSGQVRTISRARAATEPAVNEISRIVHNAAATKTRHLVLVTGVPGAGKTLVGLRAVHAHYLDDLAELRGAARPTAPAVFLSGNDPLVSVLQYELRSAGGGGATFVRPVRKYVERYAPPNRTPPEHVLVFDEAQRAFDAARMAIQHGALVARSEPEEFIAIADKIPGWCVVIGLVGTGQEIHVGEEAGLGQWRQAIVGSSRRAEWSIHAPSHLAREVQAAGVPFREVDQFNLTTELRFHAASRLHEYVRNLVTDEPQSALRPIAAELELNRYHIRLTRNLQVAREYLRERYSGDPDARYGLIASSRDRDLARFGVPNDFQATKRVKLGPWFSADASDPDGYSCRHLRECVTEFGIQGLELDAVLLAWGTDFERVGGRWSNRNARGYKEKAMVRDAMQLRRNAYRVLLTRGRDGCVVFVPEMSRLDETFTYLLDSGFRLL